ncbi:MAG: biopolymer transporter ExbD [Acidobacteria bacterium]|nr:biopolymer transporter ExbD [Acidobacteriota bacterium]
MAFTNQQGRTQTSLADINVTPFVDVVLVLLIIFMVTAPVIESGIDIDLPQTRTVKEMTQERVIVSIDSKQRLYIGSEAINVHQLGPRLRSMLRDPSRQVVILRCDKDVPFGLVAGVMDEMYQAGIKNISVVTKPLEKPPAQQGK